MKSLLRTITVSLIFTLGSVTAQGSSTPLLEQILNRQTPMSLLPYWHDYPWAKIQNAEEWTRFTYDTLESDGEALINSEPGDMNLYCPGYPRMNREERLVFWTRFISILAELESTYDPNKLYWEKQLKVHSTGLLQLSLASSQSQRYNCDIRTQEDLTDWRKNIACAIRIMAYFVGRDEVVSWYVTQAKDPYWSGVARYWQPLRDARLKTQEGRMELVKLVITKRAVWRAEGWENKHPALKDSAYRKQGESRFERLLRLTNSMPICYSSSRS